MSRLPIRLRLTLAFAAVMALLLAATGLFLYLRFADDLDETIDAGLRSRAADATALLQASGTDLAAPRARSLGEAGEGFAQVLDARGRVLDATPPLGGRAIVDGSVLARVAAGGTVFSERRLRVDEDVEPTRLLATAVERDGEMLVVVVGAALDDRDESLAALLALLVTGGAAALLLASLAGYGVASAALLPVEAMRRRAADISGANPGGRLPEPAARDEIGRLGRTLNEMLGRLEAAFERERSFVSDASHELRTPLAVLKTELELALRGGRSSEELEAALRSAAEETDRLAQLADDLLVIARSDQGGLPVRPEDVLAAQILDRVRSRYAGRAGDAGRVIEVEAAEGLRASVDPLRIEQALGNLVDNALRHGDGPVRIEASAAGAGIEWRVSDGGPGFPAEFVERAFERFTRADAGRTGGGSGLGMAIVAAIAAAHGGTASAANAPDGGASVRIITA